VIGLSLEGLRFVESPDLTRVSELIQRTWSPPCWVYDEELLRYHVGKPSGDAELTLGVEAADTGELVAYYALIPLEVAVHGYQRKAVFGSFLTTAEQTQGRGVARALQVELLRRAIAKGHEIYLAMCEVGAVSNRSIARSCEVLGLVTTTIATFKYLATPGALVRRRVVEPSPKTRSYRLSDRREVEALLQVGGPSLPLHRRIATADLDHRYLGPLARTYVHEIDGRIRGLAHLLVLSVVDAQRHYHNVYFRDLELGDLSPELRGHFLEDVLSLLGSESGDMVLAPDTGYMPPAAFRQLGFRYGARALNLLCTPLRPDDDPYAVRRTNAFCLDVY
jgi:hypothetical protein